MPENAQISSFITELRRGSLTLAVLGCLRQPHYGYALLQTMQEQQLELEANTLYPLLRRLESQGLLVSDWDTSESRPRKYYTINETGLAVYRDLMIEWHKLNNSIAAICGKEQQHGEFD